MGVVKDVALEQARSQRGLLDQAKTARRRKDVLAKLGEEILEMSQRGDLGGLERKPAIRRYLKEIDQLDRELEGSDEAYFEDMRRGAGLNDAASPFEDEGRSEAVSSANYRPPPPSQPGEARVWRPNLDELDTEEELPNIAQSVDGGDDEAEVEAAPRPARRGFSQRTRRTASRGAGGGIRFIEEEAMPGDQDNDDDLAEYMHEDDVPGEH